MAFRLPRPGPAFRFLVRHRPVTRWAARTAWALIGIALLADLLAGSRPLWCRYEGRTYMPVFESWFIPLGWTRWPEAFHRQTWHALDYDAVLFPPVPWSPGDLDLPAGKSLAPFSNPGGRSWTRTHWLGTDPLGRDVLAGMIHGTRSALLVGLVGTALALGIGLWLGGLAGFYGDRSYRAGWFTLGLTLTGGILAVYWASLVRLWLDESGGSGALTLPAFVGVAMVVLGGVHAAGRRLDRWTGVRGRTVPLDLIIMRLVEAVQSLPGMLLILGLLPLFRTSSIWNVVLVTGLIRWPGFARFIRGELLKVREMPYIEAADQAGIPPARILWRHALPNAMPPVLILTAFAISSGVLIEAFLSFIGLGVPADSVTWGSLLNQSRKAFSDWWLAVFPGLGIFLTVAAFNLLGDAIQESLEEKSPYLPI